MTAQPSEKAMAAAQALLELADALVSYSYAVAVVALALDASSAKEACKQAEETAEGLRRGYKLLEDVYAEIGLKAEAAVEEAFPFLTSLRGPASIAGQAESLE